MMDKVAVGGTDAVGAATDGEGSGEGNGVIVEVKGAVREQAETKSENAAQKANN